MATTALTPTAQPHVPGWAQRLWRLVLASVLASFGLLVLRSNLESSLSHGPMYEDQAKTVVGPVPGVLEDVWLLAVGAALSALLVRWWLPSPRDGTRLRFVPLTAVLVVAIWLGSFGQGPLGESFGVGLLPLIGVAFLLPWLPRERPRRPRVAAVVALMILVAVPPLASAALTAVEAGGVGCGSEPCVIGADGRTDFTIGLRNQSRLPLVVTAMSPAGLPPGARQLELRRSESDGTRGAPVTLPLVMQPEDQLWVESTVAVDPSTCRNRPLAEGAEVRFRVGGVARTVRLEPVAEYRGGLGCRAAP